MKTFTIEEINEHLENHRELLQFAKSKLPSKKKFSWDDREHSLTSIYIDEDGCIIANYTLYMGCGEYDREREYIEPSTLFEESA